MAHFRFISLFISLTLFSPVTHARDDTADAVKKYLASQVSDGEEAEAQDRAIADLNGDGKSEIVLVWTLLGPTYWHNTLTILAQTASGYQPVTSLPLDGEAKLVSVRDGIILIEQKVLGKNDPLCCPSIKKMVKYRWQGKKILTLKP